MYESSHSLPEGAILLEMWSENLALKARVDAAPWLRRVQQTEFDTLLGAGWGGRGTKAMLVRFFESQNDEVEILVRYAVQAGTDVCFRLDRDAAVTWLRRHRPELRLDRVFECDMAGRERPGLLRPATGAATMEHLRLRLSGSGSRT